MPSLFFTNALLPAGWAKNVCVEIDDHGWITGVTENAAAGSTAPDARIALPGMPNLHSHAFQRAMAGLAETRTAQGDSFWTWRQAMYRFVECLSPQDLHIIASQLYCEMLEAGFTAVAEFHYLHHDPAGQTYDDIGEMAASISSAAEESGIGLTLLPVFYANNGFGGKPASDGQRRFINTPDSYARLFSRIRELVSTLPDATVGITPHSLRAVTPDSLRAVLSIATDTPVHIHIAEQVREVDECVATLGKRSVEWLLGNADVDGRWCLVHATHLTTAERQGIARSGAVVGLCPITEANLGDGIFDGTGFLGDGGCYGIGSDSNIYVSVAEELRLLEYSQRLRDQGRNLLVSDGSTGRSLFDAALSGGQRSAGRKIGKLQTGYQADIIALDEDHPALIARSRDGWLDGWIFAGDNQVVTDTWVGGRHLVRDGQHINRGPARAAFRHTLRRILSA